jgi:hypothetical protein
VDEARIVRDHVGEVSRLLQRADNGVVRAFKDANDAPGGKIAATATARIFRIPRDARDYAITVHGGAGVFGGNENVALLSTFARKETETGLVDLDSTGHEVGGFRQDVPILANARDLTGVFQFAQCFFDFASIVAPETERGGDFLFVERAVFRTAEESENFLLEIVLAFHFRTEHGGKQMVWEIRRLTI